jgi:type III secretory pathway component EscS
MVMLPIIIHPRLSPYLSTAYVFIQLQEQKLPHVVNLLRLWSYLVGICRGVLSNEWQHHQHHMVYNRE